MESFGEADEMINDELSVDTLETPIGRLELRFGAAGLHAVTLMPDGAAAAGGRPGRCEFAEAFERYFAGQIDALSQLPIVPLGSDFQMRVWRELRRIPPGKTISYAQLAQRIGNPRASRAVGSANGRNPLCIVVPCHRVISADGSLGGFSAGLEAKRWLLRHEGAAFKA
jgi:methylated-DNA-[protein]-cysteine S-methyltransferase